MFDRLEDLLIRLEEIMSELSEPSVVNDTATVSEADERAERADSHCGCV